MTQKYVPQQGNPSTRQSRYLAAGLIVAIVSVIGCGGGEGSSGTGGSRTPIVPAQNSTWQIQFSGEPDLSVPADWYDFDLFETEPATINQVRARGGHVIAYINSAWQPGQPDSGKFPDSVKGSPIPGWDEERYLDIRSPIVRQLMSARLELAKKKGFDAVDIDNIDGYQNDKVFGLTETDALDFDRWIAAEAHALGLSIAQKNDGEHSAALLKWFDFAIVEECFEQSNCDLYSPIAAAGHAVFDIEYTLDRNQFCQKAQKLRFMAIRKHLSLDAFRESCW